MVTTTHITIVNAVTVTRIPLSDVAEVVTQNGLQIRLVSGMRIGTICFGSSVLAMVTGNIRARRFGRRMAPYLAANHDISNNQADRGPGTQDSAVTRFRYAAAMLMVGCIAGSLLLGFAVHPASR